jgi:hypothetical protein
MILLWLLFPADQLVQADSILVQRKPLSQVVLVVADQLDQPMDLHLEVHNLVGVADKADQLAVIYKIVVVLQPKHQEDHLLTAAQVVQLVHHGVVLAVMAPNKWVEQM